MGTMKIPQTAALLRRPHSGLSAVLFALFYAAFVLPHMRLTLSSVGLLVSIVALAIVGRHAEKFTRFFERVNMLIFAVIFVQWVLK